MKPTPTSVPAAVRRAHAPYFEDPRNGSGYCNPWRPEAMPGLGEVLRWKTGRNPHKPAAYRPKPLPIPSTAMTDFAALEGASARLFWIGHASFLMEVDGVRVLIDPVFGRAGGLVPRVTAAAAAPEQLGSVDAVVLTHGHHDHFDRSSLRALALGGARDACFVVPSGLSRSLPRECLTACELSWWQYVEVKGVRVHLVPAQHWHRRGPFDLNSSLWGGCVIEGTRRVFHSGDTGYFEGFRAIGEVFGGIDVACLPLGAYEPRWFMGPQHMSPEQSLTALDDLRARHLLGMHWGTFDLSDEPIDAGPALLWREAQGRRVSGDRLHVVLPGGSLALAHRGDEVRVCHRFEPPSAAH